MIIDFSTLTAEEFEDHQLYEKQLPRDIKLFVAERDEWKCRSCNSNYNIEVHHIVFRSRRRDHHPDNLIILCHDCHRRIHTGRLILAVVDGDYFFGGSQRWPKKP